ncbi:MAG: tetratricopeptide repeat protein [Flavobacteriales bacterium]
MRTKSVYITVLFFFLSTLAAFAQDEMENARAAYNEEKYEEALVILTDFLEKGANPEAYLLRADCLQKIGDYSMALNDYDKARIYGSKDDRLFLNRGICKSSMELFDAAKLDLITYIDKQEDDPAGYYWMAAIEYLNADNKACQRYVDMALAIDSTYSDAYYLRGANLADQGKNLQAMEAFEQSFQFNPKQHRAKLNVAIMLIDMSQFANALELLGELRLETIDFEAEVLYYRGEAFYMSHDLEGACQEWSEASHLGDPDATINYKKLCMDKGGKARFKRRSFGQF